MKTTLESLQLLELEASLEAAKELYGDPSQAAPDDDFPEATTLVFAPDELHELVVTSWKGQVHQVVYWFADPSPDDDILHIGKFYGAGKGWDELNPGYLYYRKDGEIRLWCSALPAIGVGTNEYFAAESAWKRAHEEEPRDP